MQFAFCRAQLAIIELELLYLWSVRYCGFQVFSQGTTVSRFKQCIKLGRILQRSTICRTLGFVYLGLLASAFAQIAHLRSQIILLPQCCQGHFGRVEGKFIALI